MGTSSPTMQIRGGGQHDVVRSLPDEEVKLPQLAIRQHEPAGGCRSDLHPALLRCRCAPKKLPHLLQVGLDSPKKPRFLHQGLYIRFFTSVWSGHITEGGPHVAPPGLIHPYNMPYLLHSCLATQFPFHNNIYISSFQIFSSNL